jgi:hypothetical protein
MYSYFLSFPGLVTDVYLRQRKADDDGCGYGQRRAGVTNVLFHDVFLSCLGFSVQ